jgi:Cu-Zn family superoxide dismutase
MIKAVCAALLIAGTAGVPAPATEAPITTELRTPAGVLLARAMVYPSRRGLEVIVQAAGLAPGQYGAHLHAVGRCEGRDFARAGPHWNPLRREHGSLNPRGHHLGDLPNLEVDAQRAGRLEFTIPAAELGSQTLLDGDGAAVVIHANADDYRTDPSGNSGAPIACGVLRAP